MASERCVVVCGVICILAIVLAPTIAALAIASSDGDNPCQGHDKTNLSLKDWLIGYGCTNLGFITLIGVSICIGIADQGTGMFFGIICTISAVLFSIVWTIIGIVVLARSHNKCVSEGTDIGIMTIVAIVLGPLMSLCSGGGQARAASS